jgi:hypothetical protein
MNSVFNNLLYLVYITKLYDSAKGNNPEETGRITSELLLIILFPKIYTISINMARMMMI